MFGYTGQVTLKGYDNMSGIGTPDGPNFIKAPAGTALTSFRTTSRRPVAGLDRRPGDGVPGPPSFGRARGASLRNVR